MRNTAYACQRTPRRACGRQYRSSPSRSGSGCRSSPASAVLSSGRARSPKCKLPLFLQFYLEKLRSVGRQGSRCSGVGSSVQQDDLSEFQSQSFKILKLVDCSQKMIILQLLEFKGTTQQLKITDYFIKLTNQILNKLTQLRSTDDANGKWLINQKFSSLRDFCSQSGISLKCTSTFSAWSQRMQRRSWVCSSSREWISRLPTLVFMLRKMVSRGLSWKEKGGRKNCRMLRWASAARMQSPSPSPSRWMRLRSLTTTSGHYSPASYFSSWFIFFRTPPSTRQQSALEGKPSCTSQYTTSSFRAAMITETYSSSSRGSKRLSSVPLRLRKVESEQAISSTQMTERCPWSSLSRGSMSSAYILRISLYFGLFFSMGVDFRFLQEQPISPRCREIIDREKLRWNLQWMYFDSSTAVQKGRSVSALSMMRSISTDFLYLRFFCREAMRAPPRTRFVARNSRNLWRMVEQPRCSCCPISFRLNCGFFPSSFCPVYSAKIRFISASFSFVIVVRTFRFFLLFFPWMRGQRRRRGPSLEKEGRDSQNGRQGWAAGSSPSVGSVIEIISSISISLAQRSESLAVIVDGSQGSSSQLEW